MYVKKIIIEMKKLVSSYRTDVILRIVILDTSIQKNRNHSSSFHQTNFE
jgi:hypothetical protein